MNTISLTEHFRKLCEEKAASRYIGIVEAGNFVYELGNPALAGKIWAYAAKANTEELEKMHE